LQPADGIMENISKICLHCSSPTHKESFCCFGCKSAYYLIKNLNLRDYYDYCKNIYNISPKKITDHKDEVNYADDVIQISDNKYKIYLYVDGIACGSCVWLIENSLQSLEFIISARLTVSTNRLEIIWKEDKNLILKIVKYITTLGYQVTPFNPEILNIQEEKYEQDMLKAIAVSGFATAQVMALALAVWIGNATGEMGSYLRYFLHIISGIITIPAILYASKTFIKSAFYALKNKRTNIDVPISIGIIATLLISVQETIIMSKYVYYDAAASLTFLLLIGRFLALKAKNKARHTIREIMFKRPNVANLIKKEGIVRVSANSLKEKDIVIVKPGETFPVDGYVINGKSEVDNSLITGETIPISIVKGSYVFAGTININESVNIESNKIGTNTVIDEIIKSIENIEKTGSKFVQLADKLSKYFTPFIISLSLLTFFIWLKFNIYIATLNAVSLLIITCPCAIGLAVPMVQIIIFSNLIRHGIFIKKSDIIEKLNNIDTIVFDKTGTLTIGKPTLINAEDFTTTERGIISSIASKSDHLLCKAITSKFKGNFIDMKVSEEKGRGLSAQLNDDIFLLGNREWCKVTEHEYSDENYLEVWYRKNNEKPKILFFKDIVRVEAKEVIHQLKKDYDIIILSGDNHNNVSNIAQFLGIKDFYAQKDYIQKHEFIKNLNKKGKKTLMIGDGLNDALSLKEAYSSMSPKSSIAISQNAADSLYNGNLTSILKIINHSKLAVKTIKQNFIISILYNCIAIPFAIGGYINPIIAAIVMSISSISVILNSLRLKKLQ
jgi:Cu2+-exporting ATPase